MKKLINTIILFILLIPSIVNANSCDIDKLIIKSITLEEKSEGTKELNDANFENNTINLNLTMSEVNDYANYKIIITNDSKDEYEINNDLFNINSDYIEYNISSEDNSNIVKPKSDKTIDLIVKYKKAVPNENFDTGLFSELKQLNIDLSTETNNIINPETGIKKYVLFFIIIVFMIGLYFVITNKKYNKLALLIILSIITIPYYVSAICKSSFTIDSSIQIMNDDFTGRPFYNVNLRKYYEHLDNAVDEASSNQKILVMEDAEDNVPTTIPSSISNLTLDLNGHNTNMSNSNGESSIINNGEIMLINSKDEEGSIWYFTDIKNNNKMTIKENAGLHSENDGVDNKGILNLEGGSVGSMESTGIINSGTVNIVDGNVGGYTYGIDNSNILNISNGTIAAASTAITNDADGIITISNDSHISARDSGINNSGSLIISGGTVESIVSNSSCIYNSGTVDITNTHIHNKSESYGYGIRNGNTGIVRFHSGSITKQHTNSNAYSIGVENHGEFYMDGGLINMVANTFTETGATGIVAEENSKTVITGGEVKSSNICIRINSNSTVTIGTDDNNVQETPIINGAGKSGYGIYLYNNSTLNFYDGLLKATKNVLDGQDDNNYILNLPNGYHLTQDIIDGIHVIHLTE